MTRVSPTLCLNAVDSLRKCIEVLTGRPYGVKCDLWSAGVLAFVLMGGYQPFHGGKNEDEIKNLIVKGDFNFDGKYWSHISDAAKDFIEDLLIVDPVRSSHCQDPSVDQITLFP